jgi:predicted transcriptional regulator
VTGGRVLLVSIRPEFANLIFSGAKTVELRRRRPKLIRGGDWVAVYASSPVKALVGVFQISDIHEERISDLWKMLWNRAAITRDQFDRYYSGKETGVGIGVRNVEKLQVPLELKELRVRLANFTPPQSFRYLTYDEIRRVGITAALGPNS